MRAHCPNGLDKPLRTCTEAREKLGAGSGMPCPVVAPPANPPFRVSVGGALSGYTRCVNDRSTVTPRDLDAELHAIRRHVSAGMWPEHAADALQLKKAVGLCAFGAGELPVVVGGHSSSATNVVAALGLGDFVGRRQVAALNLN